MTRREQVHSELSQDEKRDTLQNDRRVRDASAYVDHVHDDNDGGRFKNQTTRITVGSRPLVEYPALPPNSPWARDPVPDEPPIGVDLSAAPIVGEPHEIATSLGKANLDDVGDSFLQVADGASPGDAEALRGGSASSTHASRPRRRSSKHPYLRTEKGDAPRAS